MPAPGDRDAVVRFCRALGQRGFLTPHWPRGVRGSRGVAVGADDHQRGDVGGRRAPRASVHEHQLDRPRHHAGGYARAEGVPPGPHRRRERPCGARASRSPTPARTWRRFVPGRSATATCTSSTGRRSGLPTPTPPSSASCSVRTGPEASRGEGITILLVPMDLAGIEVRDIPNPWVEHLIHEVYFTDVAVPVSCRLGEENKGWEVVRQVLANERVGVARHECAERTLDGAIAAAAAAGIDVDGTGVGRGHRGGLRHLRGGPGHELRRGQRARRTIASGPRPVAAVSTGADRADGGRRGPGLPWTCSGERSLLRGSAAERQLAAGTTAADRRGKPRGPAESGGPASARSARRAESWTSNSLPSSSNSIEAMARAHAPARPVPTGRGSSGEKMDRTLLDALDAAGFLDAVRERRPHRRGPGRARGRPRRSPAPRWSARVLVGPAGGHSRPARRHRAGGSADGAMVRYGAECEAFLVLGGRSGPAGRTPTRSRSSRSTASFGPRLRPGDGPSEAASSAPKRRAGCAGPGRSRIAVEAAGTMLPAIAKTVEHVTDRHQFGRPIGSFQAVQHRLARAYVMAEGTRWLARRAAWYPRRRVPDRLGGRLRVRECRGHLHQHPAGLAGRSASPPSTAWCCGPCGYSPCGAALGGPRMHARRVAAARGQMDLSGVPSPVHLTAE